MKSKLFGTVVIALLVTSLRCNAGDDGSAALYAAMTADQKTIQEKLSGFETKISAAQKKASDSGNSIELNELKDDRAKYVAEILQTLEKPVSNWAAVVEAVSAGRKGAYTVSLKIPMAPGLDAGNSTISFSAETHDDAVIKVLRDLQKGDIVKFSGKYDGSRSRNLRTLFVRDFVLSSVEAVRK